MDFLFLTLSDRGRCSMQPRELSLSVPCTWFIWDYDEMRIKQNKKQTNWEFLRWKTDFERMRMLPTPEVKTFSHLLGHGIDILD